MGAPAPRLRNLASNCESAYVRRMTPTTQDSAVSHTIHPCIQYSSPNIEDAIKKKATSEKFLAKLIGQFKVLHVIIFTHTHTHTHTPSPHTTHYIHVQLTRSYIRPVRRQPRARVLKDHNSSYLWQADEPAGSNPKDFQRHLRRGLNRSAEHSNARLFVHCWARLVLTRRHVVDPVRNEKLQWHFGDP